MQYALLYLVTVRWSLLVVFQVTLVMLLRLVRRKLIGSLLLQCMARIVISSPGLTSPTPRGFVMRLHMVCILYRQK